MRQEIMAEDGPKGLEKIQKYIALVVGWAIKNLFSEVYGSEVLDLRRSSLCAPLF
jgi:hypothetical protein